MKQFCYAFLFALFLMSPAQAADKAFLPIESFKTSSGIPVWLVSDHSAPVIDIQIAFKNAGARNDTKNKQGVMRLLSNTLDEGAAELTSEQFQKTLADESITLSFSSSKDHFTAHIYTLSSKKDLALNLLEKALTAPRFDAEPLARMKEANLTRIRADMAEPGWIAARLMNDIYFGAHPYALNSGGTLRSLAALTADDLKAAKNALLTKDQTLIAVTGDVSAKDLLPLLDKTFSALPQTQQAQPTPEIKQPVQTGLFHFEKDIPQSVILMQGPGIDRADPDYEAALIANMVFGGGGFGSRLTEEIREKRGLTYGIYSSLADMALSDTLAISVSTNADQVQTVIDLIKAELEKMLASDISAQELADAKSYLIGSMPLSLTSSSEISSLMLGQMLDGRPVDDLDTRAAKINAVTIADVTRVAKKLFNPTQFVTVIVGPQLQNMTNIHTLQTLPNVE